MDLIGTALAKSGIPAALKAAGSFLERLLGPPAGELGLLLQDRVHARRLRNQLRALSRTQEMLRDCGLDPVKVPLRILAPLLEAASLEEDEDLTEMWAALLANAADPRKKRPVHPSFASILRELSSEDAIVLNALYSKENASETFGAGSMAGREAESILKLTGIGQTAYYLSADNLIRLGLCTGEWRGSGATKADVTFVEVDEFSTARMFHTRLGWQFLSACRHPEAS